MQLYIAGGCGDQGRNCFYIEGDRHAFIVDAGTSTDGLDRLPDLSPEMIRRAEYLFVTHSHKDHTGAIEYLENNGFTGPVLMSNQTYQQIHYKPKNTMILDSTAPELPWTASSRSAGDGRDTAPARSGTTSPWMGSVSFSPATTGRMIPSTAAMPFAVSRRILPSSTPPTAVWIGQRI